MCTELNHPQYADSGGACQMIPLTVRPQKSDHKKDHVLITSIWDILLATGDASAGGSENRLVCGGISFIEGVFILLLFLAPV
jgi:hypothetical protein